MTRRARGSASSPRATSRARPARTPTAARPAPSKVDYIRVTPDPIDCEVVAPTTTATLDPAAPATGDTYDRSVKVNLSATDGGTPAAGVEKTEYRITSNGVAGNWTTKDNSAGDATFNNQLTVSSSGTHLVEFRSTDKAANVEETKSVTFKVQLPVCDRSDEFDGTGTDLLAALAAARPQRRHAHHGRARADADRHRPAVLPTNNFELDAAAAATALGPVNFIGQDLNALGDDWQVETQFTARYTAGWQHVGLIVWQSDGNFFRSTLTHSLSGGNLYVEQSKDNPDATTPEGVRQTGGGNVTIAPNKAEAITIKMRYTRTAGANSVQGQYQVIAPAATANADWVNFPAHVRGWNTARRPAAQPDGRQTRRDSAGSRIGIISAGNFPGTTGNHPYTGTPADVKVDYFRVTPDNCPTGADQTAPTTTATAAPAAPNGLAGWYTSDVNVTLAGNDGANGSGIAKIEYKVDGGAFATYSAPVAITTRRHAHGRVPLDRQGRQRRGHQVADGQGRQGRAGDDRHDRSDHARQRSRDAHADRDRPDLGRRQERVPGQPGQPVRRLRRSVADVRAGVGGLQPGLQAGLHRPRRLLDRVPLARQRRQRRGHQDGRVHDHGPEQRSPRPGHDRVARPVEPGCGPDVRRPGHREVLGDRPGSGRRARRRTSTSTPRAPPGTRRR